MGADTTDIVNCIMEILRSERIRCTPVDLLRLVQHRKPGIRRTKVRKVISSLVDSGQLIYTQHFSTTHLECGINRPLIVSRRLALGRPDQHWVNRNDMHCVRIAAGCAFGGGEHPTTRLAMKGMDWAVSRMEAEGAVQDKMALDIGFGSGVLAIAAVLLGIGRGVGVDIDLMACHEAAANLDENGIVARVDFLHGTLNRVGGKRFALVLANLRPPTLVSLFDQMKTVTEGGGYWVLSGFRPDEGKIVETRLPNSMHPVWAGSEQNWAALVAKAVE